MRPLYRADVTHIGPPRAAPTSSSRLYLRLAVAACLLALLVAAALQPSVQRFVMQGAAALLSHDPVVTHRWVTQFGQWGPAVLTASFVVQAVLPVLPALVLVLVTLLAYGPLWGFVIVYLGTLLGAAAGYGLGYAVGDPLIRTLAGRRNRDRAHAFAHAQGVRGVLLVRLMPVLSSDVMNLVAGATRMPFLPFMLATAGGALPVTLIITWLAHVTRGAPGRLALGLGVLSLAVGAAALLRFLLRRRALPSGGTVTKT
ncbi:hypothetical protein GCM10008939_04760 [Deinococcus aquiradiocola]|uniref:TVP38/TMEM64 family membrane protein n=1 Tax=Deinococcus aquiradiocola TaxID=393059 RepID=A0A917UKJ7_9DEIO|nr:hypothetical protein GCM10008939_04760 [Deinococcus aquiradiocola]